MFSYISGLVGSTFNYIHGVLCDGPHGHHPHVGVSP